MVEYTNSFQPYLQALVSSFKLFWSIIMINPFITIPITFYITIEMFLLLQNEKTLIRRLYDKIFANEVDNE